MAAALAVIAGALWLAGGQALMTRTEMDIGTALFWIAAIVLMYPVALVVLIWDLRDGLRAARDWAALSEDERQAALAAQAAAPVPKRRRRRA